jgi:nicotinamidase-related amidase
MIPPASRADRDKAVLVLIDVQERLAAVMERREQVVSRSVLLAKAAAIVGVPVVVTRQYPEGLGDLDARLAAAVAEAAASSAAATASVDKLSFDCFCDPGFCDAVAATGRSQLVIAGMESHICVAQTALAGLAEGFDVHVAADACCSRLAECHEIAVARLGNAGAVVTTAESVSYELVGRAGTDEFRALLAAVKG